MGSTEGGHGLRLSFGDVVALSADYFVAEDLGGAGEAEAPAAAQELADGGLFELAAVPGQLGTRLGTSDEIVAALRVMADDQMTVDRGFEPAVRRPSAGPVSDDPEAERLWCTCSFGWRLRPASRVLARSNGAVVVRVALAAEDLLGDLV